MDRAQLDAEFRSFLRNLENLGLEVSGESLQVLGRYRDRIETWNERVNLVSRRDVHRLISYHFLDSAEGLVWVGDPQDARVLDLGTGAGFPGMVWKILRPSMEMTLVDSVRKRTVFLDAMVEELGLTGVRVVRDRAEALAPRPPFAGHSDIVVARTVAPLVRLCELGLPLLRDGGRLLAYKGSALSQELEEAQATIYRMGGRVAEVSKARSSVLKARRTFVVVERRTGRDA